MGTVYLAKQKAFKRNVAVKILKAEHAGQISDKKRFLREARLCAQVDDPNILGIIDSGEVDSIPYIVMEYVDGPNLQDLLKTKLQRNKGIEIIRQVASALVAAHRKKILHRDLKPENVLITGDGTVRVADWGISRALQDMEQLTRTGIVLGTPQYMAPEQIMGQKLGPPCDLYSLGVMLFQTITGRLPFREKRLSDLLQAHLKKEPPNILSLAPDITPGLANLITLLLSKDPKKRPTAEEVVQALTSADDCDKFLKETLTISPTEIGLKNQPPQGRKLWFLAFIAILLSLVGHQWWKHHQAQMAPLSIKRISLSTPNKLAITFSGSAKKQKTLYVTPEKAPPFSCPLDFSQSTAYGEGTKLLVVQLPQAVICKANVSLSPKSLTSHQINGERLFKKALAPVRKLKKKRLSNFIKELEKKRLQLRNYMDEIRSETNETNARRLWLEGDEKVDPHFYETLDEYGLDSKTLEPLKTLITAAKNTKTYAGTKIAREIMPLRMAEALMCDGGLVSIPWGPCTALAGMEHISLDGENSKTPTQIAYKSCVTREVDESGKNRKNYCWIGNPKFINKFRHQGVASLAYSALANDTARNEAIRAALRLDDDEKFPDIDEIITETEFILEIEKNQKKWPPKEVWLKLSIRSLSRDIGLYAKVNNKQSCNLLNTATGFDPIKMKTHRTRYTLIRLNPENIWEGRNSIFLQGNTLPGLNSKGMIALIELSILAEF